MKNDSSIPHDHPSLRPHPRIYFALTNHCNRSCPWCSVYSSPEKSTHLNLETFSTRLPNDGLFEVQLEGGEPTTHPLFWNFVASVRAHPRASLMVLCTNGVLFPRKEAKLRDFLLKLGSPLLIKLSVNHHLLEHDPGLLKLAQDLRLQLSSFDKCELVLNVRLRKGVRDDDKWLRTKIEDAGLADISNMFFLQRYGLASDRTEWERPFVVKEDFTMVNPDGQIFEGDLEARSEAMGALP